MMGTKVRLFGPLEQVCLEDLVPKDHFYRQVDRMLDLSFVRDLVRSCYAAVGRPSVDPVVFFKLLLAMFFEGIRSERQLMHVAADRFSLRWYLGYDLHEALPDRSSLSKIRDRYGVTIFRTTEPYKKAMRKRRVWVEPLFGEAKEWHGLARFRLRMLEKVNCEALLIATGQNLKRLLSWRGWGRRGWLAG